MSECMESCVKVEVEKKEVKVDRVEDKHEAEAIILYPSFGAPLVLKPGKPLRLIVLFEEKLHNLYVSESGPNQAKKTPKTIDVINKSLKIFRWEDGKKTPKKHLFPEAAALENIRCHFVQNISGQRKILDKDKKLVGLLRPKVRECYLSHPLGFRYLYTLEIHHLAVVKGLYDCAWALHDPKSPANSMNPPMPTPERQDILANEFLRKKGRIGKKDNTIDMINQLTGYTIKAEGQFDFTPDAKLALSNHHPIYFTDAPKLNMGQLTDIHVSSRQIPMKISNAQVLPGDKSSPKLGSLLNVSFETFKDLLDQMGKDEDIHLLALTGDLIDFNQNFDPLAAGKDWQTQFQRPAALWNWMDPRHYLGKDRDVRTYPFYIDMLTIYSLLHYYVTTYKKPIVMLTGNHEAYEMPYGVSPRLGQFGGRTPEGFKAVNEGIPADHNLTTYEAALLYGPTYYHFENFWNFEARYLEWFYMMFNPLSDFSFTYDSGAAKQSFTALEWEDSEQYIENAARGGGTLPRATRAISNLQLELLKESSKTKAEQDRVLLTHFTFISYGYDYQITQAGEVNYNDNITPGHWGMSQFDEGTFVENRKATYNMLYDGDFTHVFSGHSHRAGFYVMTGKTGAFSSNVNVKGYLIEDKPSLNPTKVTAAGKARFIVGASGGPIPVQNHYDEPSANGKAVGLGCWSLDYPSGNVLKFAADTLQLKRSSLTTAKPRFAVALSFFNVKNRVFKTFESGRKGERSEGEFEIRMHDGLPKENFIKAIKLLVYHVDEQQKPPVKGWQAYDMDATAKGPHTLRAMIGDPERWLALKERALDTQTRERKVFLAITFTEALANRVGYRQYNYDSPWIFPIKLIDKKKEMAKDSVLGAGLSTYPGGGGFHEQMMIQKMIDATYGYRVEANGKVPDFMWYQKTFNGYSTGQPVALTRVDDETPPTI